jgi:hypothetical protein
MDLWHMRSLVVYAQVDDPSILGENSATVSTIGTKDTVLGDKSNSGATTYFCEFFILSFNLKVCG